MPQRVAGRSGYAPRFLLQLETADGLDAQGRIVARTGQIFTFGRGGTANAATGIDANGRVYVAGSQQPRFVHRYDAASGLFLFDGLWIEGARTNLQKHSSDFSGWTPTGTPTRTAAAVAIGALTLDLIGDDDAGSVEQYQSATDWAFSGGGVKAVSVCVKKGPTPPAGGSYMYLYDENNGVTPCRFILSWIGTVPSVAMLDGTYRGYVVLADGVYRLLFSTAATTAGHNFIVFVAPAGTAAADTGNVYVGAVQVEDAPFPSSIIPTTTAAVTRSEDSLTCQLLALPRALTAYAGIRPEGSAVGEVAILSDSAWNLPYLRMTTSGGKYQLYHNNNPTAVTSTAAAAPAADDFTELHGVLGADGSVALGQSLNGGAEAVAATSAGAALRAAWSGTVLSLGGFSSASSAFATLRSFSMAADNQSLAYMRAA